MSACVFTHTFPSPLSPTQLAMLRSLYDEFGGKVPGRNALREASKKIGIPQTKIKSFFNKVNEGLRGDSQEGACTASCRCCGKYNEMEQMIYLLAGQLSSVEAHSARLQGKAEELERRWRLLDQRGEQQRLGKGYPCSLVSKAPFSSVPSPFASCL